MSERGERIGTTEPGVPATPNGQIDVAALRQSIEQTRAELGRTMEALAAKADVKARLRQRVRESLGRPWVAVAAGTAVLLVVFVIVRRRRE